MNCVVVPTPFVEETIFNPLTYLSSFAKDELTIFMGINVLFLFLMLWDLNFNSSYLRIVIPLEHN